MSFNHYKYGLEKASERCRSWKAFGHHRRLTNTRTHIKSHTDSQRLNVDQSDREAIRSPFFDLLCERGRSTIWRQKKGWIHPSTRAMAINTNKVSERMICGFKRTNPFAAVCFFCFFTG